MTEAFASVDVADVNFDRGNLGSADRVAKGDARMGVSAGIEYDAVAFAVCQLGYLVDQSSFVIRLEEVEFSLRKLGTQLVRQIVQGGGAVNFRLSFAKAIEIGAIQDSDAFHDRFV